MLFTIKNCFFFYRHYNASILHYIHYVTWRPVTLEAWTPYRPSSSVGRDSWVAADTCCRTRPPRWAARPSADETPRPSPTPLSPGRMASSYHRHGDWNGNENIISYQRRSKRVSWPTKIPLPSQTLPSPDRMLPHGDRYVHANYKKAGDNMFQMYWILQSMHLYYFIQVMAHLWLRDTPAFSLCYCDLNAFTVGIS